MIESGHRLELPARMPAPLYQLLYRCWRYEPAERPTFTETLACVRALIDYEETGSGGSHSSLLPPVKPPRPPHFATSSSRDSFRSSANSTPNEDPRQEDLRRTLEEQRGQSQADGMWTRKQSGGDTRFSYLPMPGSAPMPKRKIVPPLNIDRSHDEIYKALTALVQKVMDINQILEKVKTRVNNNLYRIR